jgi:hypothetical protein
MAQTFSPGAPSGTGDDMSRDRQHKIHLGGTGLRGTFLIPHQGGSSGQTIRIPATGAIQAPWKDPGVGCRRRLSRFLRLVQRRDASKRRGRRFT